MNDVVAYGGIITATDQTLIICVMLSDVKLQYLT